MSTPPAEPVAAVDDTATIQVPLVYLTIMVIATCGLVYELVAATLASYVLGDSVTQFSTIIGVYLSAMGLGAWLSRFLHADLARRFVEVELAVGLIGGSSATVLFFAFSRMPHFFRPTLYIVVLAIGILVGVEIPLVLRLLKHLVAFKDLVAEVLSFDYLGALVASLAFPLFLVPTLGLVRTALVFGLLNALVGLWSTFLFAPLLGPVRGLRLKAVLVLLVLILGLFYANQLTRIAEQDVYSDRIVYAETSRYQRIVVTRTPNHFQLFLNTNLQFSSSDEYRYHEALVHPAMASATAPRRVLVLGGGDGLAVRELLRYPELEQIVLVDLDPAMTDLARDNPLFTELNQGALRSPKVEVINGDAFIWLSQSDSLFDVAIVDFPDPHNYSVGKLYTSHFYRMLAKRLNPDGVLAVQTTSPLFARKSFWCINQTMEAAGLYVHPYHALVPSFGEWGFALARLAPFAPPTEPALPLRYLDGPTLRSLFAMPPDTARVATDINRLDDQVLVTYYERDLRHLQ